MGRELIMQDNTHGYTDFHDLTPSVETGLNKPEVVKESYVVDYTTATRETLTIHEEGGFDYRWVYGLDRLSVKVTSEGTNWWGQNVKQDILKDYAHQDRMGSTTNLTDQFGRVVGRADYNEWGELTYKEELNITSAYRRIYPQASYTGHDWDDVLGMYYAKARFYDPAAKRFVAMDPVKGNVADPLSLVPYIYCVDNPLKYVDPLGLMPRDTLRTISNLYHWGLISEDNLSTVVILLNFAHSTKTLWDQVINFLDGSIVGMLADFLYVDNESDSLVEDTVPSNQSIYVAFHEIAQIVAAKQIKNSANSLKWLGYPELEAFYLFKREIDIKWGDYIWEVKPSYHSAYSWTNSLSKYIKNYEDNKELTDYTDWEKIIGNKPGWTFETKRIKLFKRDGIQYIIGTESKGPGKVGYFFEYVCSDGDDSDEELRAKEMAAKLQALFKTGEMIKNVRGVGQMVGAVLVALLIPGQLDEMALETIAPEGLNEIIEIFSEGGLENVTEAAEIFWDLIAA